MALIKQYESRDGGFCSSPQDQTYRLQQLFVQECLFSLTHNHFCTCPPGKQTEQLDTSM